MDLNSNVDGVPGDGARTPHRPDFLFVVTYGRSGSTLLQGLLNTLPGTLVRGENNFYVLPMFRSWDLLSTFYRKHADDPRRGPRWAFYGLEEVELDDFVSFARRMMIGQLLGSKRRRDVRFLGFKEIRWYQIESSETKRFFEFFELVFPGARYVLNRRDHEQVASSGFWQKQESDDVMAALGRVEEIQDFLRETRPDRIHPTRYEQLTSSDPAVADSELRSLAGFVLGEYDDATITEMKATMGKGHGPRPFGKSRTDQSPTTP